MQHLSARSLKIITTIGLIIGCIACFGLGIATANATPSTDNKNQQAANKTTIESPDLPNHFFALLLSLDPVHLDKALRKIRDSWSPSLIPLALETMGYSQSSYVRRQLIELIESSAPNQSFQSNNDIYQWLWNQKIEPIDGYANFKANLYLSIDAKFETYFKDRQASARIRLDEILWGGVIQDGIPPLRNPAMLNVNEADYLDDDNIVFGIEINGDARAYPKRILAWHEMFTDTIGGVDIAGVYCTLCGTVIPYKTNHKGTKYQLGTSGFLYRSNKLMYDQATQSLWSTTRGTPVLGPLVDQGIELEYESVVTTTWKAWRERHPDTKVLSLKTGHNRDYGEGVAYADYFGTDQLMFNTPFTDGRLANKREVLALRFPAAPNQQLAIDTEFLNKHRVYENSIGQQHFVVLTDESGANRVYDPKGTTFTAYDGKNTVIDQKQQSWTMSESSLNALDGTRLPRLPYHRAFWFGWRAAFPDTKLIQ